ncbi:hypothetical protein BC829DRAFT_392322 [Chytridium lagenaria]|nr:hypothetical protein BC829DRAFT_392322 [Chytridium lagenaria]
MQGLKENALETDELQSKLLSAQCLIEDEKSRVRYLCEEKNDISAELEKCRENLLAFANMAEELSLLRSELAKKNAVASIANTSQESLQMYQEAVEGVALESANGSQQSLATSHGSSDNICEEMHAGGSILSLEPSVCFGNTVNTRCLSSEILPTDRNLSLLNDDNIGTPSLQTVNSQQDLAPLEILPTWRTEENSELQSQLKEVETTLARVDFHRNVVEAEAKRVFQELSEERDFLAGHSAEISEQCSQNGEDHREVEEDAIDDELVPPLAKESTQDVNENIPPSETLHIRNLKSTITQLREYIASANSKYEIANLDLSLQKSERDSLLQLQDDRIRLLMERYDRHRDEARDTEIKMTARIYDLEAEMRKAEDMVALQKLRCEAMEKERDGDRELVKGVRDEVLKTQGELLRVQAIVETTEAEKRLLEERIIILHERLKQYDAVIKEAREAAAKLENEAFDKDGAFLATDLRLERQKNEELLREAEANSGLLSQQQHDLACLKAANYEEAYRRAAVLVEANTSSLMSKIEAIEADLDVERSQSRELQTCVRKHGFLCYCSPLGTSKTLRSRNSREISSPQSPSGDDTGACRKKAGNSKNGRKPCRDGEKLGKSVSVEKCTWDFTRYDQPRFSIGSWMLHPKFKAAVAAAGNSGSTDSHNNQQRKKSLPTGDLVASFSPSPSSPLKDEDRIAQLEAFIVKLEDTLRLANSDASVALDCLTTVAVYIGIQDSHLPRPFAQGWSLTSGILSSSLPTSTIRTRAELNHQKGKIADLETLVKERDDFITDVGRMEVLVKRLQSVIEDSASVVGRRNSPAGNRSQSSSE